MEKVTLTHLEKNEDWQKAVIVFKATGDLAEYSEVERSYQVNRSDKYFNPNMIACSLYGDCLEGKDEDVRLDHYMAAEGAHRWEVDYCYILLKN